MNINQFPDKRKWTSVSQGEKLDWKYGSIIFNKNQELVLPVDAHLITIPPFSSSCNSLSLLLSDLKQEDKSLFTVEKIIKYFQNQNIRKNSKIVIQGGGLLLDMVGFAASIYKRGINNITFIPTTLLAMVDATVGGKNGVNFEQTKNMVGTINHPYQILIDIAKLDTLENRQFFNGMAEVIKMAVTFDRQFFQYLERIDLKRLRQKDMKSVLLGIIKRSLEIKIDIVQKDQFEKHERKWLNFGHTIGHAIQMHCQGQYYHGQCISIGMIKELEISQKLNILKNTTLKKRLIKILKSINLPVDINLFNVNQCLESMLKDKKKMTSDNSIQFTLIQDIGVRCAETTPAKIEIVKDIISQAIEVRYHSSLNQQINQIFQFPSSKSISLRLAYMSALSLIKFNKKALITNFLSSDDTACMLESLEGLGFNIFHDKSQKTLSINNFNRSQKGIINIGNSGITARLILPLCASLKGEWTIICHPRMSERPNKQIIALCQNQFNIDLIFLKAQYCFPLVIKTKQQKWGIKNSTISINGRDSSQFISSIMIYAAFFNNNLSIYTHKGPLVSESFLKMTAKCLSLYGTICQFKDQNIEICSKNITSRELLQVETDLSSLSYPYAFSVLHNLKKPKIPEKPIQGDQLFYGYVDRLYKDQSSHIQFDFNNCTDTFMTMAILMAASNLPKHLQSITITNIANQRVKESNRIHLTILNLKKVGINVEEYANSIKIYKPKPIMLKQGLIEFTTAGDHRLAMSMAILSTILSKSNPNVNFIIDDKKAVQKTFPNFWKYLATAGIELISASKTNFIHKPVIYESKNLIILGDRGSGKSTVGRYIAKQLNWTLIDLDQKITESIREQYNLDSITQFVAKYSWEQFRNIESVTLQRYLGQNRPKNHFILVTGAGIVQRQMNHYILQRQNGPIIFLQRRFQDLKIEITEHRPHLEGYQIISKRRNAIYKKLSSILISLTKIKSEKQEGEYVLNIIKQQIGKQKLEPGYLLTYDQLPIDLLNQNISLEQYSAVQFRIDQILKQGHSLDTAKHSFSQFKASNPKINTILTLRSKSQFGQFQGNNQSVISQLRKWPTNFLDHQFVFPLNYRFDLNRIILSYHGNNHQTIMRLINYPYFPGIKKLCYKPVPERQNLYEVYRKLMHKTSICVNLDDPLSRLTNQYQFVGLKSNNSLTNIKTLAQMRQLKLLMKLLSKK